MANYTVKVMQPVETEYYMTMHVTADSLEEARSKAPDIAVKLDDNNQASWTENVESRRAIRPMKVVEVA